MLESSASLSLSPDSSAWTRAVTRSSWGCFWRRAKHLLQVGDKGFDFAFALAVAEAATAGGDDGL